MTLRLTALVIAMTILLSGCALNEPRGDVFTSDDTQVYTESEFTSEPDMTEIAEETSDVTENAESDVTEEELTPIYDTSAILEAYRNGDPSPLSEMDRAIYDAALEAVAEFYHDSMSESEIVIAAHDWIVTNITYDTAMLLAIPEKTPETENPYGALILREGICMGYTTTFQLFMDMLGIESQIVRGTATDGSVWEEHAWNLVNIGGEYYHVDTTWDDFVPDEPDRQAFHMYLLVPDYVMAPLHRWDKDATPKATAEDLIYYKTHGLYTDSKHGSSLILDAAFADGQSYCEIMTPTEREVSYSHVLQYWPIDFTNYTVTIYWMK